MTIPTIFDTCRPRPDVLHGSISDADFAADLAQVIAARGNSEYIDAERFFANTYPTRGLRNLLANVFRRLTGTGGEAAAIFRLDTSYGGGKTHGLIALTHAAHGATNVPNIEEFIERGLLPNKPVRVAAFDGENADPANGRAMGDGVLAHTPWGEIAFELAGKDGYERVRNSDQTRVAPGAETLRELFGEQPALILLDELSVYLRKIQNLDNANTQLTAFLTSLIKAVESAPNAVLVYTLAIGKDGKAADAYTQENQFIADNMAEAERISARKATLLNPTEDDETVQVLRRRLFEVIDEDRAAPVIESYIQAWSVQRDSLAETAARPETADAFRAGYPFHPDVLATLTGKTATLDNFQRVRGMLRLLARTIARLWEQQPADATAIHLHHIDIGHEPIRQEIVTRLELQRYVPAINGDVAAPGADRQSLAEQIDAKHHDGMPPYGVYAARTIFLHTLAFNEPLQGLVPDELRYSALGPAINITFVEEARQKFVAESAFLDDRPGVPMRFLVEPNLRRIITREEQHVDAGEAQDELRDRIRRTFLGNTFDPILFPGGTFDVPDDAPDRRPKLVVLSYDAVTVGDSVTAVPDLVERIHAYKGSDGTALRRLRNNLVFLVADDARLAEMQRHMRRRLALRNLKQADRIRDLAEHQQDQVRELESKSEQELAIAIQQCYRHLFYPSRERLDVQGPDLAHTAIEMHAAADRPGHGQRQVEHTLRDQQKLRLSTDAPDSPSYVRDRTPLKKGRITTLALREEFLREPGLPILVGDNAFLRGIRDGIDHGEYVYQRDDLLFGQGDAIATINIDEQSMVYTMDYARNQRIWPRPAPEGPPPPQPEPPGDGPGPSPDPGQEPGACKFTAEGVLKEALTLVFQQARAKKVEAIKTLTIHMFSAPDAFPLLGVVGAVPGAEKTVRINGGYETSDGGSLEMAFRGSVADAQPVREFLQPQLRAATTTTLKVEFQLAFTDGLSMQGDSADALKERFARFGSGPAAVSAVPKNLS